MRGTPTRETSSGGGKRPKIKPFLYFFSLFFSHGRESGAHGSHTFAEAGATGWDARGEPLRARVLTRKRKEKKVRVFSIHDVILAQGPC